MDKLPGYYTRQFIYLTVTVIAGSATYYACSLLAGDNIISLLGKMCICVVLPNTLYFILHFKNPDFKIAIPWIIRTMGFDRLKLFKKLGAYIEK